MKRFLLTLTILVIAAGGAGVLAMNSVSHALQQAINVKQATPLVVKRGTSYFQLIAELENSQYIDSSIWLKIAVKLDPELAQLKAGTYQITPQQPLNRLLRDIAAGHEMQFSITLVEGLTFKQWLAQLNNHPHTSQPMDDSSVNAWISNNALAGDSVEGWLLADTYAFTANTPVVSIIERAHAAMRHTLAELWQNRIPTLPYERPYEALIMASIIEKETGVAHEREHIAGVFVNRLHQNMRLQTDPTVIYGIGDTFDGNLTRKHLRTTTPYNTYRINGLPPTPIAMPGEAALRAAFNPLMTDDLYFVSKGDGTHFFSETLEQHNQAVRQYQLNQKP